MPTKKTAKRSVKKPANKPVTRAEFNKLVERVKDAQACASAANAVDQTLYRAFGILDSRLDKLLDAHNDLVVGYNELAADFYKYIESENARLKSRLAKKCAQLNSELKSLRSALN